MSLFSQFRCFYAGTQSALIQADNFARFSLGPQTPIPVVAGDIYRIGIWVQAGSDFQIQPSTPGMALRLNLMTGSGPAAAGLIFIYLNNTVSQAGPPDFAPQPVAAPVPTTWTHIEAVVKIPEGVDSLVPTLFFWKAKGSLYVDDFSFQKVDPTTAVSPVMGASSAPKP